MRTNDDVLRDIKLFPFLDVEGNEILPGQIICIGFDIDEKPIFAPTDIIDGEFTIGGVFIDEVLENHDVLVTGWIQ